MSIVQAFLYVSFSSYNSSVIQKVEYATENFKLHQLTGSGMDHYTPGVQSMEEIL